MKIIMQYIIKIAIGTIVIAAYLKLRNLLISMRGVNIKRYRGINWENIVFSNIDYNAINIINLADLLNIEYAFLLADTEIDKSVFNKIKNKLFMVDTQQGETEVLMEKCNLSETLAIMKERADAFIVYDVSREYTKGIAVDMFESKEIKDYCINDNCKCSIEVLCAENQIVVGLNKKRINCKDIVRKVKKVKFI